MSHAVDDRLCHDIAGQAVSFLLPALSPDHMAEYAMKHQMQIYPVHHDPVLPVQTAQILGVVIQIKPIGSHPASPLVQDKDKARKCHIHEPHLEIQFIAGRSQNLSAYAI